MLVPFSREKKEPKRVFNPRALHAHPTGPTPSSFCDGNGASVKYVRVWILSALAIIGQTIRKRRRFLLEFAQFCACGPSGYAQLKQRVDACAKLGRSYEFAACRLPAGCRPDSAQLGFWRHGEDYLLYFRPGVAYGGSDPLLRAFFGRGAVQRYPGFGALAGCLHALDENAAALRPDGLRPDGLRPDGLRPNAQPKEPDLLTRLHRELGSRVLGQEEAVEAAAFKLWSHISKREPLRPLSLIFYGPTGVGKSELGKAVAPALNRCLGEERYRLVWTELNTFTQAHSVYRLTGAPPGYVGYEDAPVLEVVRDWPHTVFMFDELDKAHPEVLKVFMSILDEGRCAARREDKTGSRELDFRRCVLLFTTNTDLSGQERPRLGFAPTPPRRAPSPGENSSGGLPRRIFQADEAARLALTRSGVLREIAGRFSGLIGFQPLSQAAREAVTARQIAALGREYGLDIAQVEPTLAQALTPKDALSLRSSVPMLEGALTSLFLAHAPLGGRPLRLEGSPECMTLSPIGKPRRE